MTLALVALLRQIGEQTIWVAAVVAAIGGLSRTRPAKWLWRRLVALPVTEWGERVVGAVVDDKVSKPNGGSSVVDRLDGLKANQEILANGSVAAWTRQDQVIARVDDIHSCLEERFGGVDLQIIKLSEMSESVLQEAVGATGRIRQIYRALDMPVFETDDSGWCTYVNPAWTRLTGLPIEEAQGEGWAESLHPVDRDRVFRTWGKAVDEHKDFTAIYRLRNVNTSAVANVRGSASPLHDGSGNVVGWVGTLDLLPDGDTMMDVGPDVELLEEL